MDPPDTQTPTRQQASRNSTRFLSSASASRSASHASGRTNQYPTPFSQPDPLETAQSWAENRLEALPLCFAPLPASVVGGDISEFTSGKLVTIPLLCSIANTLASLEMRVNQLSGASSRPSRSPRPRIQASQSSRHQSRIWLPITLVGIAYLIFKSEVYGSI